jgi:methionyl-tRNA formyltransferase
MRIVLCAYHAIGIDVLEHVLQRRDVDEVAVFTHEATPGIPDVAARARAAGLVVSTQRLTPDRIPFAPDVIASVYYRNLIRQDVIDAVEGRIFNVHPSLLPRHRGCSSVPWSIIEGDSVTGVTFHYIDAGIDTGRILLQATTPIAPDETQATLYRRLMEIGARFWPAALDLVKSGFEGVVQDDGGCYHPRGAPNGGEIDSAWPIDHVERFIRAMVLPPLPYATYRGKYVRSLDEYLALRTNAGSGTRS